MALKGNKKSISSTSALNARDYVVKNIIMGMVNTAIPVVVTGVQAGSGYVGTVTVKPLVTQVDGFGNAVQPVELFNIPYCRIQGGIAALIIDPVVGDTGICVFAKSDCTGVKGGVKTPVKPGSFRKYSMADGWYIGGFLNQAPTCFLELKQDNTCNLTANSGVTVNANAGCTINTMGGGTLINGNTTINGNLVVTSGHTSTMNGNINVISGDVTADGISLKHHTHGGVEPGSGSTGEPQ